MEEARISREIAALPSQRESCPGQRIPKPRLIPYPQSRPSAGTAERTTQLVSYPLYGYDTTNAERFVVYGIVRGSGPRPGAECATQSVS